MQVSVYARWQQLLMQQAVALGPSARAQPDCTSGQQLRVGTLLHAGLSLS